MGQRLIYSILCVALVALTATEALAQHHPERRKVRQGNEQFEKRNFRNSLNRYNEALECDSTLYEGLYNRANAYYHATQQYTNDSLYNWQTSNSMFEQIANDHLLDDKSRAEVYRNLGESLFTQKQYEAALNAFRESLRLNPADSETKYNFVLTKRIVDQLRSQQQQGGENQNQNQQNQQDQQNQQNQQQGGEGNDNQNDSGNDQQNDPNKGNDGKGKNDPNKENKNDNSDNGENPNDKDSDNKDDKDSDKKGDKDGNNNSDKEGDKEDDRRNQPQGGDKPQKSGMSREEQERLLSLIQAQEDKTQEKLNDKKQGVIIPGKKNW